MLLKNQMIIRLAGWAIALICRLWFCTLRVQWEHHGLDNDPRGAGNRGRMFCLWHEDMLPLGYVCRNRGIFVLISRSKDGELITQVIERLGFQTVRGSTNRGGASAAREIITGLHGVSAAITPDGPRGPRREFQLGAVFLSSRTSMPLVPIGLAYERPWRLGSWDKLAIPRPFSRVVICFGPALPVPAGADREQLESHRLRITALMEESTSRAESLLRRWRKGEKLPLISPEAKAASGTTQRKAA